MCKWMPTKQHDHVSKLLGVQQVILGKLLESWTCRKVCIWRVDVVSKPATNHVYNSSSAFKHDIRWYFHSTLKHQGQYKESHTSLTRKGSTMKGNFSQQKFSRSHFLMHSSRFVPLRWHCWCCQSVNGNVRFHRSTMAWPCVLSWLPRVAKAISWERLVDHCPFEVDCQRNRIWTNKSEAATNSDTLCASKQEPWRKTTNKLLQYSYPYLLYPKQQEKWEKSRNGHHFGGCYRVLAWCRLVASMDRNHRGRSLLPILPQ